MTNEPSICSPTTRKGSRGLRSNKLKSLFNSGSSASPALFLSLSAASLKNSSFHRASESQNHYTTSVIALSSRRENRFTVSVERSNCPIAVRVRWSGVHQLNPPLVVRCHARVSSAERERLPRWIRGRGFRFQAESTKPPLPAPRLASRSGCHHSSKALEPSLTPDSGKRL